MFAIVQRLRRRPQRDPRTNGRGLSKRVEDRYKETRVLVGSIRGHKDNVAARLREMQAPYLLAGESPPDHALALELVAREVEAAFDDLSRADIAQARAVMSHLAVLRLRREFMRREMYPAVRDLRQLIEGALGREAGRMIHGLCGRTRRKIEPLELQARMLASKLGSHSGDLFNASGEPVDPRVWLRQIAPLLERRQELDNAINLRDQAMSQPKSDLEDRLQAFDATYGRALRYARSVYRRAGCGAGSLRNLRSETQQRRLARWAGFRREDRAAAREQAARRAAREPKAGGAVAALGGWLRRRWAAGGRR